MQAIEKKLSKNANTNPMFNQITIVSDIIWFDLADAIIRVYKIAVIWK